MHPSQEQSHVDGKHSDQFVTCQLWKEQVTLDPFTILLDVDEGLSDACQSMIYRRNTDELSTTMRSIIAEHATGCEVFASLPQDHVTEISSSRLRQIALSATSRMCTGPSSPGSCDWRVSQSRTSTMNDSPRMGQCRSEISALSNSSRTRPLESFAEACSHALQSSR